MIPAGSAESVVELTAYELKEYLATKGYNLPVVTDSDAASVKEILIGDTSRNSAVMPSDYRYAVYLDSNNKVQIAASSSYSYEAALNYIKSRGGIVENVNRQSNAASGFEGSATHMEKADDSIRVMFYNNYLYGDPDENRTTTGGPCMLRVELQLDIYKAYRPDVIGFQEFRDKYEDDGVIPREYMTQQLKSIGYEIVEVDETFQGYDDLNDTPIFYNANTVSVLKSGYLCYDLYDLSSSAASAFNPNLDGNNDLWNPATNNGYSKSLTWAVFEVKAGENKGDRFAVISTHFMYNDSRLSTSGGVVADDTYRTEDDISIGNLIRVENAKQALDVVASIKSAYANIPIVFGGDLNAQLATDPINVLTNGGMALAADMAASTDGAVYDTYGGKGYSTYDYTKKIYTKVNNVSTSNTGIDHILFENEGKVTIRKYLTLNDRTSRIPSDHVPKMVDFVIN